MTLRAFGGAYKHQIGGEHRLAITVGLMGAAARAGVVVLVNDVASDPRYLITPGSAGTGAELAVPILLGSRVLGVVNVERALPFAQDDADALRVVADQLAVAIENARLHEEAQRAAALEERHRLARELHDSVTQLLFSATLVAQSIGSAYARDPAEGATRAAQLLELNRSALAEMRALLSELRPLPRAVGDNAARPRRARRRVGGAGGAVRCAPLPRGAGRAADAARVGARRRVGAAASVCEEALYRIAREALHNVVKHAQATQVDIKLSVRDRLVRLLVLDDGIGIATAKEGRRGSQADGRVGARDNARAGDRDRWRAADHEGAGRWHQRRSVAPRAAGHRMSERVRVLIADDHQVVREGLRLILAEAPELDVVGEASTGDEAVQLAERLRPDVVLMDLRMPGLNGIEATRRLHDAGTANAVVILTTFGDDERVREAIQAGAIGYLLKDVLKDELVRSIRAAARGVPTLDPRAQRLLNAPGDRPAPRSPFESLTARERDVFG